MTAQLSTAEKIETIVFSFLSGRVANGTFGTLVEFDPGRYRVVADGKTVIVRNTAHGWRVSFKGYAGQDDTLLDAARLAFDGGSRRDVSSVADALS